MTWLKGQTTWQNVISDLTKLACGEIADGGGVTVPVAERWGRVVAGQDLIMSPASSDVPLGNMSNRAGYWYMPRVGDVPVMGTFARQTAIATSVPGTPVAGRWVVRLFVNLINSVAGNYSTAQIGWQIYDADTGTSFNSGTLFPTAGGQISHSNFGTMIVGDPSGVLRLNAEFIRVFTSTYRGGIDFWGPLFPRRRADATFSTAPDGVAGTDYDASIEIPLGSTGSGAALTHGGGIAQGLGYKTAVALTGNVYTYTFAAALFTARLFASAATVGVISIEVQGRYALDAVYQNPTWRRMGGRSLSTWLRPYATPASVTNASLIQYWLRVTANGLVVILNADPGQSGVLTCNWLFAFPPINTTYDKFPIGWGPVAQNYTSSGPSNSSHTMEQQFTLAIQKAYQDGSEGRDWQTGWSRGDADSSAWTAGGGRSLFSTLGSTRYDQGVGMSPPPPRSSKPNPTDGKWWLWQSGWMDDMGFEQNGGQTDQAAVDVIPRGATADVLWIPGDGWSNGDELTDPATGDVYFLVGADYHGILGRNTRTTNVHVGGVAVLEE